MIDEKGLLRWLRDYQFEFFAGVGCEKEYNFIENLIKGIENQPKVGEWIPCSERLPGAAGFYLVTKKQRSGEIQVALGSYQPLFKSWSGNGNFKEVLAWMPLPEPYKEDMRGGVKKNEDNCDAK